MKQPSHMLIATGNTHKFGEIVAILAPLLAGVTFLSLKDVGVEAIPEGVESGATFEENAIAKAVWCSNKTGLPSIADDSGLCVDALGGAPGIRSARWAGPTDADRNRRLLEEMKSNGAMSSESRKARFVCCAVFAPMSGLVITVRGEAAGTIIIDQQGGKGFGYDPLFLSDDLGVTFAEAGEAAKNQVSHRARAFRKLAERMLG